MTNEQEFIRRVEVAQPDELQLLLISASPVEEEVLRTYLGEARYQRMRALALRQSAARGAHEPRGHVVVLHGIMGGELAAFQGHTPSERPASLRQIWMRVVQLALGEFRFLRLDSSGEREHDPAHQVQATGIMKRHYGEQLLALAARWEVRAFWYDWRKDLRFAAKELHLKLTEWFDDRPVHLVAHSMGGLVARTFIAEYGDHWERLWDEEGNGRRGGRLVMLGTPNHGSFAAPQILTGVEGVVRKLALFDLRHSLDDVLGVANTFVGSYQLLPSPLAAPTKGGAEAWRRLYDAETYGRDGVSQAHLSGALEYQAGLRAAVDPRRMVYVAGYNQPTYSGITDWEGFRDRNPKVARKAYAVTLEGDGRVPHALGHLERDGARVPVYFVEEEHGALPQNAQVLGALDDLLERGRTTRLPDKLPLKRSEVNEDEARERMEAVERARDEDEERIRAYVSLRNRRVAPTPSGAPAPHVTTDDRVAEDLTTQGFLSPPPAARRLSVEAPFEPPRLHVRVVCGDIGSGPGAPRGWPPADAVSVGHYRGVRPTHAERALDRALSRARLGRGSEEGELLITQLAERGVIRGDLAQPFFLPDYRARGPGARDHVVAVAGMGDPGRFGVPELTVLVRELVWALGRLGKRHLASVLIGTGSGNLPVEEAVPAWIRGFKHALTGVVERTRVEHLTLVELSPARAIEIDAALRKVQWELGAKRMSLVYEPFGPAEIRRLERQEKERQMAALQMESGRRAGTRGSAAPKQTPPAPTRLTVTLEGDAYRFGAITHDASVPERVVQIDPRLIEQANDQLVAGEDPVRQRDDGRLLERLLFPQDLRPHLASDVPLVVLLDAAAARIHWEMAAQPDVSPSTDRSGEGALTHDRSADEAFYLGVCRGFTRQLRTQFAPPPEPPPPLRRVLRVLVVADPAADARLFGAEEEGIEVADLFESYNDLYADRDNRVEVVRLFGPREATRLNVLRELTLRSYDMLHFAGHCVYDAVSPAASGWIFTGGERLSARELNRIDRIPGFVFSNACESGITPDRSLSRTADLAPSFAEAFFQRGVANFVCTAWPVDDLAARTFARVLYGRLLGILAEGGDGSSGGAAYLRAASQNAAPMYLAMQEARRAIMRAPNGARTWGAYQHYGNPYYRFFPPSEGPPKEATRGGPRKRGTARGSSPGST